MTFKTLAWFVLLVPAFLGVGVYTFLLPMVGEWLSVIAGFCAGLLLVCVVANNLGKPLC